MELNSHSCIQSGKMKIRVNGVTLEKSDTNFPRAMRDDAQLGITQSEKHDYENTEVFSSLPTLFEGKMSVREPKLSSREQLSNTDNLRISVSNNDVRGGDPRPLSPFFSHCSSQESLDENFVLRPTGLRMINRKVPSPIPACITSTRRRTLSDGPTAALISPVIPRRRLSPRQLKEGMSRVRSCPVINSGSDEHLNKSSSSPPVSPRFTFTELSYAGAQPQNRTKFHSTPIGASPTLTSADQEKLPRIHQTRGSPMLVKTQRTPTESARELFNVSPVLGESAVSINQDNNIQCDLNDKVQYYLHTISAEKDIDQ